MSIKCIGCGKFISRLKSCVIVEINEEDKEEDEEDKRAKQLGRACYMCVFGPNDPLPGIEYL